MWQNLRVWPFLSCKITLMTMFYHMVLGFNEWVKTSVRMWVCVCMFMTSGEVIAFSWSSLIVSRDIWDWRLKRENTKQPRAVFTSKIYPPIFLRQILVSVNMASKVKAWLHSNKCSMCMPWVNYVHVIFISSECNSIYYCVFVTSNYLN